MGKLPDSPSFYIILYMLILNIYSFVIMGTDKWKSSRNGWRTPEKRFFACASVGGAAGIYLGMRVFHHKTLHNKFRYGIPALLLLNIIIYAFLLGGRI